MELALDRRAYLVALGSAALAGCLGGGSGGDGSGSTPAGGSGGTRGTDSGSTLPPPVQGDPESSVTVMVFEDFSCPHCAHYEAEILPKIESSYVEPGKIRYEHRDFPIPVSPQWSWPVASAAREVQVAAGDAAFFAFARACFSNQSDYSLDLLGSLAEKQGVDAARVRTAAKEQTHRSTVEGDRQFGESLGLQGTPQVYVNRKRLDTYDFETVSAAIDSAK